MNLKNLKQILAAMTLLALVFACEDDSRPENTLPSASFQVSESNPEIDHMITFTDRSADEDGSIVNWLWNFGDNTTSTDQNPEHAFSAKGTYVVTLTVTDDAGATASSTAEIIVFDPAELNAAPAALFTMSDSVALTGTDIAFENNSTDSDGSIVAYSWDFGDGTISTDENPTHVYETIGTYEVSMTVVDNLDETATITKKIYVGGVVWSYVTASGYESTTPAIADDGTVFMTSSGKEGNPNVFAINADGTKKWEIETGDIVRSSIVISNDGSTVYTHSYDDHFYALNANNGSTVWSYNITNNAKYSTAALGADGSLYNGSQTDNVHALNADGTEKWVFATGGDVNGSAVIGSDGTIYIHSTDGFLYAINPADGSQKWKYKYGSWSGTSLAIDASDNIYVTGEADAETGVIAAVSSAGTELWKINTSVVPGSSSTTGKIDQGGAAIGPDGTLYVGTKGPELLALNPANGTIKWTYTKAGFAGIGSTPAVDKHGNVYFGDDSGIFTVLDKNGILKFEMSLGSKIWSSATIGDDGKIYIGATQADGTGMIYAIELYAGAPADSPWPMRHGDRRHTGRL